MHLIVYVICTLVIQVPFSSCNNPKKSKSVTTLLNAKWQQSPLVLEMAEYLADENVDFFWNYIDEITHLEPPLVEIENDKERYQKAIFGASKFLSPSEVNVMKLALSLHVYAPKVEMFNQMAGELHADCVTFANVGGVITCGVEEMNVLIKQNPSEKAETFQIDHHYPTSENNSLTVILYGEIGSAEFARFHRELKAKALSGQVDYVVRHFVKRSSSIPKLRLSGYGVELQMKSTEYKAQDDTEIKDDGGTGTDADGGDDEVEGFNFDKLRHLYPQKYTDLGKFKQHLIETSSEMAPLKVWQFQELSLQAAERIMAAPKDEALHVLAHIAQNFPIQAKSLVKTKVRDELKSEIRQNQMLFATHLNLQSSDTAIFINGMFFDLDVTDIYALLDVIRQEQRTMQGLYNIGISNKHIPSLLELDLTNNETPGMMSQSSSSSQTFAIDIRDSAINWVNNIEKDSKYRRWSSSLMELLRPTFPGMLRNVRRNLYNLVLVVDPKDVDARHLIKLAESFYVHSAPLRVGVVFDVTDDATMRAADDAGVAFVCAFNYISQLKHAGDALAFVTEVYANVKENVPVTVEDIKKQLKKELPASVDMDEVLGDDSDYDFGRSLAKDFVQRLGLKTPAALINGVPLASNMMTPDDFEEAVLTEIMSQTTALQKAVYRGEFVDSQDTLDYLMDKPSVMPRLNQRVLQQNTAQYLDMTGQAVTDFHADVFKLFRVSNRDLIATGLKFMKYFVPKRTNERVMTTLWVVGDLSGEKSRALLRAALEYMKTNGDARVTFIPNVERTQASDLKINKLVLAALYTYDSDKSLAYVLKVLDGSVNDIPPELNGAYIEMETYLKLFRVFCQRVLNLPAGQRTVIANARHLGAFNDDETFDVEDFQLLERFVMNTYGNKLKKLLKKHDDFDNEITSDQLIQLIVLLIARTQTRTRFDVVHHASEFSVLKIAAQNPMLPALKIAAIVDPVSRGAQKLAPILDTLQRVLNCDVQVFLNSVDKCSDMPLKSFYRFVLDSDIQFNEHGKQLDGPVARFTNMPSSPLLTQNVHVPDNWLVGVVSAVYDLDNIRLGDVDSVVHSEYELEHLLLEGHCFEANTGTPPRGLQLTLGTQTDPVNVDTIVMANLGYFQLKANPGAWILRLRQGRSALIYDIVSHDGSDTPKDSPDIKVLISSFKSHVLKLKVLKKPEMKNAELLGEDEPTPGIWNSITSSFSGSGTKPSDEEEDDKLNIFSLASGHLYERCIKIMMLSVLKNTKTPVKFWFLKNYLSPQIKDFLPYMAKKYNFEFELIEYKWPRWLNQQTEKQRTIWGYKILFLDVLFPLSVKKIIFVDADQIVRADLKELRDLDLGGAPYGYTPFCDSRREMDGFRFWKQGYWRNHLQGRKYHISALYVVDLKRFRKIAAGDRLRGQYQALSQDKNSLSNLDQDLPNNMIHQVAIKSLPQEWLWCETWCDDQSKAKAKTIDLCNNPLTKEAKLSAAVRIVKEWKDYDQEIRDLQQQFERGHESEHIDEDKPERIDTHTEL